MASRFGAAAAIAESRMCVGSPNKAPSSVSMREGGKASTMAGGLVCWDSRVLLLEPVKNTGHVFEHVYGLRF